MRWPFAMPPHDVLQTFAGLGQSFISRLRDFQCPRRVAGEQQTLQFRSRQGVVAVHASHQVQPPVQVDHGYGGKGAYGYDACTAEYGDMLEEGILDPAKVTLLALQNAASVAGLLLTTEVMIETSAGNPAEVFPFVHLLTPLSTHRISRWRPHLRLPQPDSSAANASMVIDFIGSRLRLAPFVENWTPKVATRR